VRQARTKNYALRSVCDAPWRLFTESRTWRQTRHGLRWCEGQSGLPIGVKKHARISGQGRAAIQQLTNTGACDETGRKEAGHGLPLLLRVYYISVSTARHTAHKPPTLPDASGGRDSSAEPMVYAVCRMLAPSHLVLATADADPCSKATHSHQGNSARPTTCDRPS
jgi:hypothetical protein